jgi:hypothetical protein|tara:strand:+ start:2477 stop:2902 length:426 start_codon:yes stop_codon:yes gene_type:complete
MIKYSLICKECDLNFESWFASSKEYEKLKKRNLLNCYNCNSLNVDKGLMAPSINRRTYDKTEKDLKKYKKIKKTITEYQTFIKNNFKYVGKNFAYEARSMHYNDKKKEKGIYGTVSKKDLKELKEEGVDTQMMPWIEDNSN